MGLSPASRNSLAIEEARRSSAFFPQNARPRPLANEKREGPILSTSLACRPTLNPLTDSPFSRTSERLSPRYGMHLAIKVKYAFQP